MTHFGVDFTPALFDFSWSSLRRMRWCALHSSFSSSRARRFSSPLCRRPAARRRVCLDAAWTALLILGLTDFVFAFSYRVNDRYVFFLPMYLVCALFIGSVGTKLSAG